MLDKFLKCVFANERLVWGFLWSLLKNRFLLVLKDAFSCVTDGELAKMVGMWLFWTKLAKICNFSFSQLNIFTLRSCSRKWNWKNGAKTVFYMPFDGFWQIEPTKFSCLKSIIRYFSDKNTRMKNYYRNVS